VRGTPLKTALASAVSFFRRHFNQGGGVNARGGSEGVVAHDGIIGGMEGAWPSDFLLAIFLERERS